MYYNNDNQLEIEINYIPSSNKNYKFNNKGIVLIKMYMKFIETYTSSTKQMKRLVIMVEFWFSSIYDPMKCSTPGILVHHQHPEATQTHVHWAGDAIQPSHPLSSPSLPALNLLQHQGLFKWVSSSHQVAKVLEFLLQHQSFQWTPRTDLL